MSELKVGTRVKICMVERQYAQYEGRFGVVDSIPPTFKNFRYVKLDLVGRERVNKVKLFHKSQLEEVES